ncbi:hypothetical protein CPB86DRAFT_800701 [Serendipita vermifera]|nr:hypothetical protein CPB86DRAFT_800701 [Serendipita vermifera]
MKFLAIFTTLVVFTTGAFAVALTDEEIAAARKRISDPASSPDSLGLKAGCDYNTPCKGYGWQPGLHCGDGAYGCIYGHVYQIGSDDNVCDYGVRDSCVQCGQLECPA